MIVIITLWMLLICILHRPILDDCCHHFMDVFFMQSRQKVYLKSKVSITI